jgi:hypothetical protein
MQRAFSFQVMGSSITGGRDYWASIMVVLLSVELELIPVHQDFDILEVHFWPFVLVVRIQVKKPLFYPKSADMFVPSTAW